MIDKSSSYKMLSFTDAYLEYNMNKMDLIYALKTEFMSNHGNYYYSVMPFGLKNDSATYERLMDVVFSKQIGNNLEAYIDDAIVKMLEGERRASDL